MVTQTFILKLKEEMDAQELHGCIDDALGKEFCSGVELVRVPNDDKMIKTIKEIMDSEEYELIVHDCTCCSSRMYDEESVKRMLAIAINQKVE